MVVQATQRLLYIGVVQTKTNESTFAFLRSFDLSFDNPLDDIQRSQHQAIVEAWRNNL